MSQRINPNAQSGSTNPTQRWFKWAGNEGALTYWNGEENVDVPFPLRFLLIDVKSKIVGWDDANQSRIFSNEIANTANEPFSVASSGGKIVEGLYNDIKSKLNELGCKFANSLYIAFQNEEGEFVIGNITFKGAALKAWVDFSSNNKGSLYTSAIELTGADKAKKGAITYYTPTFELQEATKQEDARAGELQQVLMDYRNGSTAEVVESNDVTVDLDDTEDLPF